VKVLSVSKISIGLELWTIDGGKEKVCFFQSITAVLLEFTRLFYSASIIWKELKITGVVNFGGKKNISCRRLSLVVVIG
jgi:hypothetical protein